MDGRTMLRLLNRALGRWTGLQIRRAPRPQKKKTKAAALAVRAGRLPDYRPPTNPQVDRLVREPVFLITPVRSGATLLRMLLGGHSRLHAPHELHVRRLEVTAGTDLAVEAMSELDLQRTDLEHLLWDRVLHRELVRSGKDVLVEKTPNNAFAFQRIATCWPDARFVFLLRHPVSIAQSWYEADPSSRTPEEAAVQTLHYTRATERARRELPGHVVRYEDLTTDPEGVLRSICGFLGIEYEPEMLDYGTREEGELPKGLGDWKEKIRSGRVQQGRALPEPAEVPEALREISIAWGYLSDPATPAGTLSAEVTGVWPRDGLIRIAGRFLGAPPAPDLTAGLTSDPTADPAADPAGDPAVRWRLAVSMTGAPEHHLDYPATLHGATFEVSVPVADLAPPGIALPAKWDLHLTADTDGDVRRVRLQAPRTLHDIEQKKNIVVFPAQSVSSDADTIQVKPYYTVRNNLSITCQLRDDLSRTAS
ncbi:sulfotransferase [Streptomyces sp. WMMC500]|uniref:sulfotransferase family protein n=1 Tax=Streptomyces sp. WMMC500 TaxID=3015154 RepID=UPI00248ACC49|nr:sulfotransferase [Streptomyces sp. WMMC500]WBB64142.1 sulfotransferase [Streptomyces sp. WMMC500]